MKINFTKIVVFSLICLFFFGDFFLLKKKLQKLLAALNNLIYLIKNNYKTNSRKKGFEPSAFGFGNRCSTN